MRNNIKVCKIRNYLFKKKNKSIATSKYTYVNFILHVQKNMLFSNKFVRRFVIFVFCTGVLFTTWYSIDFAKIKQSWKKSDGRQWESIFQRQSLKDSSKHLISKEMKVRLEEALKNAQTKYTILIWEPPFGSTDPHVLNSSECGVCEVTYDKDKISDSATKAVVFHFNELEKSGFPTDRRKDQLYTWWTMEAPPSLRMLRSITLKDYDQKFNLTMSHRRDSDVYTPYGTAGGMYKRFKDKDSGDTFNDIERIVSKKSKLALWVVSNCGATNGAVKRMKYVKSLKEAGLNLDARGTCFPENPPAKQIEMAREYKFYLAFENGIHCIDYITEKLFYNAFEMEAVPVVMGARREDYAALLPPGSYIFAEDFDSPRHLVAYLNYLNKNNSAYKQYFKWRRLNLENMPQFERIGEFCQLCRIIHGINIDNLFNPNYDKLYSKIPLFGYHNHSRIVPSLRKWFYGSETRDCLQRY